ncbi:unnamed protein product [Calypogeia fissa]
MFWDGGGQGLRGPSSGQISKEWDGVRVGSKGTVRNPLKYFTNLSVGQEEREEDSVSEEERAKISQVRRLFGFVETQAACE